jgi:ADP-ribose pyrophosphatase YjhB (NUDIX family)
MLYYALKRFAGIFFNLLNILLGGNLPPFGSVTVIVEREHQFLVVKQRNGRVVFPGGFIRWSEHPEQAVIREGKEETGLELRPIRIIGHYARRARRIDRMSVITIVYQAEVISGELRKSIEGQPFWINEEDLLNKLPWHYRTTFQDYLRSHERQSEASIHECIIDG